MESSNDGAAQRRPAGLLAARARCLQLDVPAQQDMVEKQSWREVQVNADQGSSSVRKLRVVIREMLHPV
jgi:hypothetical protein